MEVFLNVERKVGNDKVVNVCGLWIEEVSVNDEEAKEGGKRLTCGVPVAFFVFFSRNGMIWTKF